jgi:hypothetical protein
VAHSGSVIKFQDMRRATQAATRRSRTRGQVSKTPGGAAPGAWRTYCNSQITTINPDTIMSAIQSPANSRDSRSPMLKAFAALDEIKRAALERDHRPAGTPQHGGKRFARVPAEYLEIVIVKR